MAGELGEQVRATHGVLRGLSGFFGRVTMYRVAAVCKGAMTRLPPRTGWLHFPDRFAEGDGGKGEMMRFSIGAVLSVITGINMVPFVEVMRIMDYMTSDILTDIGRVMMQPTCSAALKMQFPALAGAEPPATINGAVAWPTWLAAMRAQHGDALDVQPL